MKKLLMTLFAMSVSLIAENLIPGGDFTTAKQNLSDIAMTNGGKAELFTEDGNWNKCAKLYVDKIRKNDDGTEGVNCVLWVGRTPSWGTKVKPNTQYRFSAEICGNAPSAGMAGVTWDKGKDVWHQNKASGISFEVTKDWKTFRGKFKTGPNAEFGGVQIQLWSNSKYGQPFKLNDYILVDNVILEEETNVLGASVNSEIPKVPVRKAALATEKETVFSDFCVLNHPDEASDLTSFKISRDNVSFKLDVTCLEPDGVATGNKPWAGDCVEIFFVTSGKIYQFVSGSANAVYTSEKNLKWEHKAEVFNDKWTLHAEIPYESINFKPSRGDSLLFNVARQRKNKKQLLTWSPLKDGFSNTKLFGELVIDDYAAAFTKAFSKEASAMDRAAYENAVADARYEAVKAKYEAFANMKFSVAPVPVISDYAIPFAPEAIFNPVKQIDIFAAVNERKPLPIAIANLTDKVAEYRVTIETVEPGEMGLNKYNGFYGLKGFPPKQIEQRFAVRYKDSNTDEGCLRLDPLPLVNQACTIVIPPKESGIVWFDFNTEDVKPGKYEGIIRVIPLSELGKFTKIGPSYHWRKYEGDMLDIPTSLTVRNIILPKEPVIPMSFFQDAENESQFKLMFECGTRVFGISPWGFQFPKNADGSLDIDEAKWPESTLKVIANVKKHLAWAKKYNSKITFFIGYSAFHVCKSNYKEKNWEIWLKGLKAVMDKCGVPEKDYTLEIWDEPAIAAMDEVVSSLKRAKEAVPTLNTCMTMGANNMEVKLLSQFSQYVDTWILWSDGYFSRPEHLNFFQNEQKAGKAIRHYTCDTSNRSNLHSRYRRNAWHGARFNLNGNCMYQFADGMAGYGNSDWKSTSTGSVSYRSFDEFMPSIRYMAIREGMTDIKYLSLVKDKVFVRKAIDRVVKLNAHLTTEPDTVREEAAQLILQGK